MTVSYYIQLPSFIEYKIKEVRAFLSKLKNKKLNNTMKNDVVRWIVKNKDDRNKTNKNHLHKVSDNFDQSVNICVPELSLPQLPRRLTRTQISASTKKNAITEPIPRHIASTTINCDNCNENKSFQHQLRKTKNIPYKAHICACATRNVFCLKQFIPLSAVDSSSYTFFKPPNELTRQPQNSSIFSQIIFSLSSTKLLIFYLQIIYLVFLCNINVVVAMSISETLPTELNGRETGEEVEMDSQGHFTHTWAVHIPNGDIGLADQVARDHGFVNLGKIFNDHYHFAHHHVSKRSLEPAFCHQIRLDEDKRVQWSAQQKAKSRSKRDFIRMRPSRTSSRSLSLVDAISFSDPKWPLMWYLNRGGDLDMNVIPAWKEGYTGKGIVVTILDDGLESDHPDIEHNYDPKASYDVNSHDEDPMPHYDMTDSNRHGTRCAGEVAATANNTICAVGIAYGASVGGVRMLDGDVTDAVEARSLSLNPQHIDIYSASWGPDDDGKTVDGPGELASRAFIEGVTKGRNGKGSIFIWASGNGGREQDNCNCDGYTNSIWTLSISSATEEGNVPWYSEKCSSTLATTYSSGGQSEKQVVTTDLHHSCTVSHTGTSASAPLAAGIAALVLEANQNLTWRDLQHIVVRTAKPANLRDSTWSKNGVGRRISHSFGYGLMDAAAMIRLARTWKMVPEQQRCEINAPHVDKVIPPKSYITLQLTVKHCLSVNYLEHVQAKITLTSQRRGDIQLILKSPAGTKVTLLTTRVHDISRSGFNQWPFMSVHTWGESPHGNWQLEIHNEGRFMGHAMLREWSLIFYGTTFPISPNDPKSTPRASINEFTTPNNSATVPTTNMHQFYSEQYPRIMSNNLGISTGGGRGQSSKISSKFAPNKAVYVPERSQIAVTGNINNKKQQQQQQKQKSHLGIADTFDPVNGPTSKIRNNISGKNKSSEVKGNKNNNNGKSSSNKKDPKSTATPHPKNKFYQISNKKLKDKTAAITPHRSKTPNVQLNERQPNYDSRQMSPKVIGDVIITNSGTTLVSRLSKLAVKATKQIKESQSALQSHEKITINVQRIPKMFERYEKIQAIFPEFQPYQGPKEVISNDAKNRKQFQSYQTADISTVLPFYAPSSLRPSTSNGISKPSRENSKKSSFSFMQEQLQKQNFKTKQQLLPVAVSTTTASSPSRDRAVNQRQGSAASKPAKKKTNAQITQWDLIFHGTETPAQPEDITNSSPGQFTPYGNDMDHNHLDFDPNTDSGQWRNVEQVGESSLMSNDKTNTACLKATIDQKCLACAYPTFIYNGRCYLECPPHTFDPIKQVRSEDPYNYFKINNSEENEELQSIDRKRFALYPISTNANVERSCIICDRTCLRCYGPLNSQCSTCFPGSRIRKAPLSNETFCYIFTERSSGNSENESLSWSSATNGAKNCLRSDLPMYIMITILAVIVVLIIVVLNTSLKKKMSCHHCVSGNLLNYSYDRVALLPEEELNGFINDSTGIDVYTRDEKNNCVVDVHLPSAFNVITSEKVKSFA